MVRLFHGKSLRFTALGTVWAAWRGPGHYFCLWCPWSKPQLLGLHVRFFPLVTFWDSNRVTALHREARGFFVDFKTRFPSESGAVHVRWVKDLEDALQGAEFFAC